MDVSLFYLPSVNSVAKVLERFRNNISRDVRCQKEIIKAPSISG
jgi:hypothetical protein